MSGPTLKGRYNKGTHDVSGIPAYVFEASLDTLDDAADRTSILYALLALEDDTRMSDDGHRLASRQEHVAEH